MEYLYKANGKYFVLSKQKKKEVKVGVYNDEVAEILSGLDPHEKVDIIDYAVMEKQM